MPAYCLKQGQGKLHIDIKHLIGVLARVAEWLNYSVAYQVKILRRPDVSCFYLRHHALLYGDYSCFYPKNSISDSSSKFARSPTVNHSTGTRYAKSEIHTVTSNFALR
jgi:hypothetical protein